MFNMFTSCGSFNLPERKHVSAIVVSLLNTALHCIKLLDK